MRTYRTSDVCLKTGLSQHDLQDWVKKGYVTLSTKRENKWKPLIYTDKEVERIQKIFRFVCLDNMHPKQAAEHLDKMEEWTKTLEKTPTARKYSSSMVSEETGLCRTVFWRWIRLGFLKIQATCKGRGYSMMYTEEELDKIKKFSHLVYVEGISAKDAADHLHQENQ